MQNVQHNPTRACYSELAKTIRTIKASPDASFRVRPIASPADGVWTDSALYGADGELFEFGSGEDSDRELYRKHTVYSQCGAVVALIGEHDLDKIESVPTSVMGWRTRASKRVLHATFAADSDA